MVNNDDAWTWVALRAENFFGTKLMSSYLTALKILYTRIQCIDMYVRSMYNTIHGIRNYNTEYVLYIVHGLDHA